VLLAGNIQWHGARAGSNQDVSGSKLLALDDDHIRAGEAGEAVKGIDPVFGKLPFPIARDHIGAAALKHHQVAPINPRLADDAMPVHTALRVDHLGAADQHPFRIAATQGTRTAERAMVNHCDRAPRLAHASRRHLRGGAGAYDKKIIIIHGSPPAEAAAIESDRTTQCHSALRLFKLAHLHGNVFSSIALIFA
jgi:hypothetical protein